jgi:hypothetical protein
MISIWQIISLLLKGVVVLDMAAYTCNPNYLGGRRPWLQASSKKLGVVAYACHPSYAGSINRRVTVQAKHKTLFET